MPLPAKVYKADAERTTPTMPKGQINMAKTISTKPVDRSAITGRFVTGTYADRHPNTTEHEHVPVHNPKKK
jgi:hypothetical protein